MPRFLRPQLARPFDEAHLSLVNINGNDVVVFGEQACERKAYVAEANYGNGHVAQPFVGRDVLKSNFDNYTVRNVRLPRLD